MRSLTRSVLVLVGCDVVEPPVASSRAALSAPVRVFMPDASVRPRDLPPRVILPVDGGALVIADEPWFTDGSGQPATFLGDLSPGPDQGVGIFKRVALFNGE